MVWLARAQAHIVYLCMRFVAGICDFFVDSFENCPMLSSLSARACGGKVGAGTVEAEEKNMGGCVLMVGFFCCCAGRYLVELVKTDRLDRGGIRALCAVLSLHLFISWLEGW